MHSGGVVCLRSLFLCSVVLASPGKGARLLPRLPPPILRPGCTPAAVNVSSLCTTILRHWREPFLFNMGQVPMFPCCCCCVAHWPSTRSSQSSFSHRLGFWPAVHSGSLSSIHRRGAVGKWPRPQRHMKYQLRSDLPHRSRQDCNFSLIECEQNTFSQCMHRCTHCVSTSHCTHSLYHISGPRTFCGLCAQNT